MQLNDWMLWQAKDSDVARAMLVEEARWLRRVAGCDRIIAAHGCARTADGFALATQFAGAGDLDAHIYPDRCATPSCCAHACCRAR